MTDAAYRLAARLAVAGKWRGHSVETGAMLARVRAMRKLSSGLGLATLPPVVRSPKLARGESGPDVVCRAGPGATHALEVVRRQTLARAAGGKRSVPFSHTLPRPLLGARRTGAARNGVGHTLAAGVRPAFSVARVNTPYLPAALGGLGAGPRASGAKMRPGPRLAVLTRALPNPTHADPIIAAKNSTKTGRHLAASLPQQGVAPGFHRTVRQPQTKAAAGNVYLDKTLVGYHLAAVVTAEQTRAAARPNGSAVSFNSSMAALRPSGAGL